MKNFALILFLFILTLSIIGCSPQQIEHISTNSKTVYPEYSYVIDSPELNLPTADNYTAFMHFYQGEASTEEKALALQLTAQALQEGSVIPCRQIMTRNERTDCLERIAVLTKNSDICQEYRDLFIASTGNDFTDFIRSCKLKVQYSLK